jgi:hypothetical protein
MKESYDETSTSPPPTSFVKGRWVPVVSKNGDATTAADEPCYEYQLLTADDTVVASGDQAVLDFIHAHDYNNEHDDNSVVCCIQDDYQFWSAHDCEPWAGKPVWMSTIHHHRPCTQNSGGGSNDTDDDAATATYHHYHHVLFDDNMYGTSYFPKASFFPFLLLTTTSIFWNLDDPIVTDTLTCRHNLAHDSIACVRREVIDTHHPAAAGGNGTAHRSSFVSLTGQEILAQQGVHLVKVPTILPILDEDWFVKEITNLCRVVFSATGDDVC